MADFKGLRGDSSDNIPGCLDWAENGGFFAGAIWQFGKFVCAHLEEVESPAVRESYGRMKGCSLEQRSPNILRFDPDFAALGHLCYA